MSVDSNFFIKKKILIYGLGKSGLASYNFLKKKSDVFLYDDFKIRTNNLQTKKKIISYKKVLSLNFDQIILSPGIDSNKCKLAKFLKKNYDKIYTDLDVFYAFYKNDCITITGTNGKSTTSKLLYEALYDQNFCVRLAGNIGYPILSIKKISKKTIIVIEASSYQLEYSKIFRSKYAAILNLSPDHIERHKSIKRYVKAKFKLLDNQLKSHVSFVKKEDKLIQDELKSRKFKCKVIRVNNKKKDGSLKTISNSYFNSESNKENLSFVLAICKKLKLKKKSLKKTIQNFKGLNYRQEIILKKSNLIVINDSKSTSFSSSESILRMNSNIFWLLGGINKKGDKFTLSKKYFKNIRAFIYGENYQFFKKELNGKIRYEIFSDLNKALIRASKIIKANKLTKKTLLFSPSAASFDKFKNFEDRGLYFNKLVKKYFNGV